MCSKIEKREKLTSQSANTAQSFDIFFKDNEFYLSTTS